MLKSVDRSVRRKVMFVSITTALIALLLSGVALVVLDVSQYRQSWASDLGTQADILALSSAPALAFDDRQAAAENLAALRARTSILAASLYRPSGERFASFLRAGHPEPPAHADLSAGGDWVENGELIVRRDVRQEGERIGIIELRARFEPFARLKDYLAILTVVMLASMAAAVLLSATLQRAVTAPLVAMAGLARRIMEERDYSLRARRTTHDEIGTLVDALNDMLGEIERHAGALQTANRNLEREMQDRLVAEAALRSADVRKDEFLATLAHELRNPLAALSSASQLLTRGADNPMAMRVARDTLSRQIEHMSRLLDDLLDVSRITRGKLVLRKESVRLDELVDAAVQSIQKQMEERHQTLKLDVPEPHTKITVDSLRMVQVINNLLTNAVKYTDPGGHVELLVRCAATELAITVRDNGIGIPPEALPRIFGMFSQVHSALERSQGGLGIGLALAKGLVELHGGTIEAHSEGTGRGSEFIVRLPLVEAPRPPVGQDLLDSSWAAKPRRLLIADDNRDALVSLAMLLEMEGHEVATAGDGEEALEVAAQFKPDVVLLDIGMPRLNGYEVAERLRSSNGDSMTLIAITGWGQDEDKRRAAAAGFDHHLTKPVNPRALSALLAETAPAP